MTIITLTSRSRRTAPAPSRLRLRRPAAQPHRPGPREPDDIALVLHTSGTTSRPKIVPLRTGNVAASAPATSRDARLTAKDRALEHHAAVPHPRPDRGACSRRCRRGGSVFCTPGFNALKFFAWHRRGRSRPGTRRVPTMHQAILAARDAQRGNRSRATRCASSARRRRRCRRR